MCGAGDSDGSGGGELAALLDAVERLRLRSREGRTPEQVGEELIALRHICDLLELEFAVDAAAFAATEEYDAQGSVSPVSWIRHHCHMTGHAAAAAVCVGEQLTTLPQSTEALVAGRIGAAHLALLAGTARALRASCTTGGRQTGRRGGGDRTVVGRAGDRGGCRTGDGEGRTGQGEGLTTGRSEAGSRTRSMSSISLVNGR